MPTSDKRERGCGPAGNACALGFSIFLVGGLIGLILFLTDTGGALVRTITGGASDVSSPGKSAASILNPTCTHLGRTGSQCNLCDAGFWGPNCTACPSCGTHGACDGSGTTSGTGTCRCATGWTTSSSSESCDACAVGYYGPGCTPCPSCSGHGTCVDSGTHGTDGSCACTSSNSSSGTSSSFAGADCGECAPGHYGPNCQKCASDCGSHGHCSDGMQGDGSCVCNPGFIGQTCDNCAPGLGWTPNSSTACRLGPGLISIGEGIYVACSGHGTLNNVTGQCTCDANMTGPGCEVQVCEQDQFGEECSGTCRDCAPGQGECDGAGTTFGTGACRCKDNYSGAECRQCKPGFTGRFCNITCPVGSDLVCSGHGTCVNDGIALNNNNQAGTCNCVPGYSGNDCSIENATLKSCLKSSSSASCTGRGTCQNGNECVCNEGWDAGTLCEEALSGWVKISDGQGGASNEHVEECPGSANNPCSGHGVCSDTGNTKASCSCDEGYSGDACEMCAQGYFFDAQGGICTECPGGAQIPCNGQGICHNTTGLCMCANGWSDLSNCTECEDGFWGDRCYSCPRGSDLASGLSATCSGHGTCSDGRLSSEGRCTCAAGFSGQACDSCDYGRFGPSCQACPTSSSGAVCSNQGVCDGDGTQRGSGKCLCFPRISGAKCDKCIPGHHGPDCAPCPGLDSNNGGKPCYGHGICSGAGERLIGGGVCSCDAGWRGADCGEKIPCSDLDECTGHGDCVASTCFCHNGWAGDKCQTRIIQPDFCEPTCSGLDEKCINQRCQTTAPPSDPCATMSCSDGQGLCASGSCACHPGFQGDICNSIAPTAYAWKEKEPWSACSQPCGDQVG